MSTLVKRVYREKYFRIPVLEYHLSRRTSLKKVDMNE